MPRKPVRLWEPPPPAILAKETQTSRGLKDRCGQAILRMASWLKLEAMSRRGEVVTNPSTFDWIVAIFAVVVQVGGAGVIYAFFFEPNPYARGICGQDQNPVSTVCVAASLASIVIASSFVYRDIGQLLARNRAVLAYVTLVVISVAWSILILI